MKTKERNQEFIKLFIAFSRENYKRFDAILNDKEKIEILSVDMICEANELRNSFNLVADFVEKYCKDFKFKN